MARNGVKTGGRVKGSINKKTSQELDRASRVLHLIETKYLEKDIKKLTSNQRVILYSDMMEYKAPKLSRTEVHGGTDNKITLEIIRNGKTPPEGTAPGATESL